MAPGEGMTSGLCSHYRRSFLCVISIFCAISSSYTSFLVLLPHSWTFWRLVCSTRLLCYFFHTVHDLISLPTLPVFLTAPSAVLSSVDCYLVSRGVHYLWIVLAHRLFCCSWIFLVMDLARVTSKQEPSGNYLQINWFWPCSPPDILSIAVSFTLRGLPHSVLFISVQ